MILFRKGFGMPPRKFSVSLLDSTPQPGVGSISKVQRLTGRGSFAKSHVGMSRAPRSSFGGELRKFIDSELLLQLSNLVNHLEETVFSKQRVFFLFEILAEGIVLVRGDDRPERRKEDCILPCLVRSVHAKERAQRIGQPVAVRDVLEGAEGAQFADLRRETPPGRVLFLQSVD